MSVRIKDLTKPQQKLWRAARAYAKAEAFFATENLEYGDGGRDSGDMQYAEDNRNRAASRLYRAIHDTMIVDALE